MIGLEPFPGPNTIRILITTDNHVGYNENDAITGDDSWKSFDEIMNIGKSHNVDMVLQGGDLFHVNKPSKKSMYQVMKTLRSYCMGDKPCELELLSDPAQVLQYNDFTNVNYEDPNLNISIPVFSISGNHDDASGDGLLCPMDILQVSGLVNHFGKVTESDKIEINPLLFQKGETRLALYGLASVRDERLFRTFKEGHVKFNVPNTEQDNWFNLMCVHQNHTGHTNTAFLPETFLPDFLNMVIWGHEHECIPHLVHNPIKNFDVLQPGSSVATSLCDAESKLKQVFILEIENGSKPRLTAIPLHTVRPFIMKDISLRDFPSLKPHDKESISQFLYSQIEEMIAIADEDSRTRFNDGDKDDEKVTEKENSPELPLPLVRLRVNYTAGIDSQIDYQVENPRRFSNRFVGRVANANNVVQFYKKRLPTASNKKKTKFDASDVSLLSIQEGGDLQVQTLVNDFLHKMQLSLLPELGLNEAIRQFVDKDDKNALKQFIDAEISHEVDILAQSKDVIDTDNVTSLKQLVKEVKQQNQGFSSKKNSSLLSSAVILNSEDENKDDLSDPVDPSSEYNKTKKLDTCSKRMQPNKRKRYVESQNEDDEDSDNIYDIETNQGVLDVLEDNPDKSTLALVESDNNEDEEVENSKMATPKTRRKTTVAKPKARAKNTRTPKTDALSELLARRAK